MGETGVRWGIRSQGIARLRLWQATTSFFRACPLSRSPVDFDAPRQWYSSNLRAV